ncbi:translation machinery-associated protein 16-like [Biomphalaria glabrata]|uniref:Translation machinery-associated protein 16-like n=1 Tax=Biomphalaria glabrata TaxID=6526 RepID=A0A9U8E329_BIOGL|nr:translation machinery-associated protein 16-like [Biomphalaria glabrata]KAI8765655.1 translation machinery-associated protein 16-like; partial [Biomphalaria glabrata]
MPKVNKPKVSLKDVKERPFHPYSRKALQLNKVLTHDKRVENAKSNQMIKSELLADKLLWFQDHLDDRHIYTKQDMLELVMQYRDRFRDELEQISIVQNVGNRQNSKQHVSREASIKMTAEDETNQFEGSGIEVPDLINKKHLEEFKKWNGEIKFIQNLKLRKISCVDLQRLNDKALKDTCSDD